MDDKALKKKMECVCVCVGGGLVLHMFSTSTAVQRCVKINSAKL